MEVDDRLKKKAFKCAKKSLTSSRVLVYFDPTLPIKLAGDALAYGVVAVITHVQSDGSERPIAFASCTSSSSERNYARVEKEALALTYGVKKFHYYLYGLKFTLVTDHKALSTILGPKHGIPSQAAARLQRGLCYCQLTSDIPFKPNKHHANADGLSRLLLRSEESSQLSEKVQIFNSAQIEASHFIRLKEPLTTIQF